MRLGPVMLAIALISLALAPVVGLVRSPSPVQLIVVYLVEFFAIPTLITLILQNTLRPEGRRDLIIFRFWLFIFALFMVMPAIFLFWIAVSNVPWR